MRLRLPALFLLALSCLTCTRSMPGLKITAGLGRGGQGGLAADDQLIKTVTIIDLENQPRIVREELYKKGDVPRGQDLSVALNQVPLGTKYLVQFLAIYENINSGASRYFYGSSSGDVQPSLTIEITAENIADSDRVLRAAGRFVNGRGEALSGQLTIDYQPLRPEPSLHVATVPIQDGWFSLTVPQAKAGNLRVLFNGEVVFPRLSISAPEFALVSSQLLKLVKPLSFSLGDAGQVIPHSEADLFLGLWGLEVGQVCYPAAGETIGGEFSNPGLNLPLEYATVTPSILQVRPAGGGVLVSGPSAGCALLFDPQRVSEDLPFYH